MLINLPKVCGVYRYNVLMSKMTWLNVGGQADVLFKPHDIDDLAHLVKNAELPINIIGATSNIIVRDSGIRGITIKLGKEFAYIKSNGDNSIIAGGAVLLSNLARFAEEQQVGGFEFLVGIPGTVGGGVEMNAGAYGDDIAGIVQSVKAINLADGNLYTLSPQEMGYFYRGHNLAGKWAFVEAEFKGVKSERQLIRQRMKEIIIKKNQSQPTSGKTAGCIFKNPQNHQAWELIDQSQCRGLSIGGAKISDKHCNFLINDNNATASDLESLGNKVQKMVKDKFNIDLIWEIRVMMQ
ncbi:MAG TPA: UDP-N-acetylenolpyruvoylglucosamine reductase [Wolbachia sp.]|uniref:UDP-N-acetylmuramate dehydrogenase n=1 Tax=Wolbachia endosymbiont of Pentalonia nigronervosa TaxID=1301914 RepID=UPI000EBA957C|nr:UDP-N-acetylmuramate dehydrogenase [Wolbachia endosymbiont of Pentalonia nigronervosa]MBD0391205.1 UDP-N-acetylmuramate dehydrogenase [Wolbachia endosymbiont of Pentalonia nigronervosa]HCE59618.1 UDP-N-acetylenolpyruvoylglucosamine reductase [Wolbachia sp.]